MYGFQFIEKDIEHPLIIVNEDICKEAMNECKKQQINPYNKKSENTAASAAPSIKTEASDIPEGSPSRDLGKYNEILKKFIEQGYFKNITEPNLVSFLDLVALGTFCDVVQLTTINRYFVSKGLEVIKLRKSKALTAIFDNSKINKIFSLTNSLVLFS